MRALPAVPLLLLLCVVPATAGAAAGDLDRRFGGDGRAVISLREASTQARAVTVQRDGKVLVTGTGGHRPGWVVTRLTAAGRPDRSFGRRGRVIVPLPAWGEPLALELQPDGRILVGGMPSPDGNSPRAHVARLLPDGRLDRTWGDRGIGTLEAPGRLFFGGMARMPDGGVAVTASMHVRDQQLVVMRLGPDGRPDRSFGESGAYVDPEPGAGNGILATPDGRLIAGGSTGSYYGTPRELVLGLTADGRVDGRWGRDGRVVGRPGTAIHGLQHGPGGGIVARGRVGSQAAVLWLRADGSRREEWGLEGRASVAAAGWATAHAVDHEGQVYVTGAAGWPPAPRVTRLDATGAPSLGFGREITARVPLPRGLAQAVGEAIAVGPGERVYVAASAADRLGGDREDYGFTHALVARLKGWCHLVSAGRPYVSSRRGIYAAAGCHSRGCRLRAEVRDRRGRRIALRRAGTHFSRLRTTRRLRRGERLSIRISARNAAGQADTTIRRLTVPRRRR